MDDLATRLGVPQSELPTLTRLSEAAIYLLSVFEMPSDDAAVLRLVAHWYDNRGLAKINGTVMLLPGMPLAIGPADKDHSLETALVLIAGAAIGAFFMWLAIH